jgi:hypothetical protein
LVDSKISPIFALSINQLKTNFMATKSATTATKVVKKSAKPYGYCYDKHSNFVEVSAPLTAPEIRKLKVKK